ncbi:MAG: hypothetical protein ACKOHK_13120, partial [Planctomycetia bacterium]
MNERQAGGEPSVFAGRGEPSIFAGRGEPVDFASFDELVESLARWSGALPAWPPARAVRAEWEQIEP